MAIIDDKASSPRAVTVAARALMAATAQTVSTLATASQIRAADELTAQVAELKARLESMADAAPKPRPRPRSRTRP